MQKRRQSGFTLLEVMVVIVILGILAVTMVASLAADKRDDQRAAGDNEPQTPDRV